MICSGCKDESKCDDVNDSETSGVNYKMKRKMGDFISFIRL